jgi:UDP-N-acetylglucosamine:LPS N-acetylglucosamine transferase
MSAKEALGARLPIVTFRPISGHGRDDAAALERLGLTDVVDQPADLLASMDRLVNQPGLRSARAARGRDLFVADAADLVLARLERQPALAGAAGGSQSASEE